MLNYATAYARACFRPILVRANAKLPSQADWQKSNPTPEAAATLFATHRGNVGVTFPPEFFALDVDGEEGRASLEQLKATHGDFTKTLAQRTQSGGQHFIYRKPANVSLKNAVRFMPGLDIRAEGGQIVVEPSAIDGRKYQWLNWDVLSGASPDIADAPDWLLALLTAPATAAIKPSPQAHSQTAEGGRNDGLTRLAGAMRRQGADCSRAGHC